jgi:hypothetical protein
MTWQPDATIRDFRTVARLAGVELANDAIEVESLLAPHVSPTKSPAGKMAVYVFSKRPVILKIGKVGAKSQARYTSHHYNPGSAMSTLASSLLLDRERLGLAEISQDAIGAWMKQYVDRVNLLLNESIGVPVLTLLEVFLQCRFKPIYEGFKSQRAQQAFL